MAIEVKDLIHVAKITTIKRRGAPAADVGNIRDFLPALARQRMDTLPTRPFDAPKARNGLYALDEAFQGIYHAFAAMPPEMASFRPKPISFDDLVNQPRIMASHG